MILFLLRMARRNPTDKKKIKISKGRIKFLIESLDFGFFFIIVLLDLVEFKKII